MKTGPKRSPLQREQERSTISRLVLQGKTHQEIANFLELERSTITKEIKAIRSEWQRSSLRDFDEDRGQKLAELELVKSELWQSWHDSKEQKETILKEKIGGGGEIGKLKIATRNQSSTGDAAYLSGVVACLKEEAKLLGLYPEEPISNQSINLTDGQLSVIGQLMGEQNDVRAD